MSIPLLKRRPLRELKSEEKGATLVEFAIVAPVLILTVMGVFDMAHSQYTSALMNGAMQKAGRDLTLEDAGSKQNAIDATVEEQIRNVVPSAANVRLEKLSYYDFEDIGEAEEFSDTNGDEICNNGEVFADYNGNGIWDSVRGESGIGGARDAVMYTAVVTYDRVFPMYRLAGLPQEVELRASTVLRNQPYDEQNEQNIGQGNCD